VDHAHFTPVASLVGGILIGLATAFLWILNGRVAGITGIVGELFARTPGESRWRLAFVAGLVGGGALVHTLRPTAFDLPRGGVGTLIVAGLLVGYGTRLANGCTSGHGLCGVSRLSPRSLAATCIFMGVGMLTVYVVRHVVGGAP
jgi:uncharacterized membrane protein YedE/YeeE